MQLSLPIRVRHCWPGRYPTHFSLHFSCSAWHLQVMGKLRVNLMGLARGEGAVDLSELDESQRNRLRVKFSGDLDGTSLPVVMTLQQAQEVIQAIPGRLAASGGVPIGWCIMMCGIGMGGWS